MRVFVFSLVLAAALTGQSQYEIHAGYEIRDGYAVTRGDILLGRAEEIAAKDGDSRAAAATPVTGRRWTNATLYYSIDGDIPNPARIQAAVEHWNARTAMRVEPWTGQSNRVRFQRGTSVCSSFVGMRGGEQPIMVPDGCSTGSLIHEIGHAFGLLHEQERADRNTWVTVLPQNIDPQFLYAFEADLSGSQDLSYYDYDSIMQYPSTAFSRGFMDTIETVPVGIPMGQRNGLSAGDIDAVARLYGIVPAQTTITTIPAGLPITVDGAQYTSPQSFPWESGSTHSVAVEPQFGGETTYRLVRWSDDGDPLHTVTASPERTVFAAVFQQLHPAYARTISGGGLTNIQPQAPYPNDMYPERMPLRIQAAAGTGNTFFSWSGQPSVASFGYGFAAESADVQVGTALTDFRATFVTSPPVTVDTEPPGLQVIIAGTTRRTPSRVSMTPGSQHALVAISPQTRNAGATILNFASWSDGGGQSHEITAPGLEGATFTARYNARHRLTVSIIGSGSVILSPPSPDGFYDEGTPVRLRANAGAGSALRYWTGDLAGGGEQTIVMDGPKAVTANFGLPLPFVVYNGASFTLNPRPTVPLTAFAPGEMVTIFSDVPIGPPGLVTAQIIGNRFSDNLGGTRILFGGVPAPLVYSAEKQVTAIVPWSVPQSSVDVAIERNGQVVARQTLGVVPSFPAMFTETANGLGQIRALNGDLTINSVDHPVEAGGVIVIYATGSGELNAAVEDGSIADGNLIGVKAPVMVRIGKLPAEVTYAGSAPDIVHGAFQVNAIVPKEALADPKAPIQLIVGNAASPPGTTIAIR